MSKDINEFDKKARARAEFVEKNPTLITLEMENIIKSNEIKVLKQEIRANKIKINFLRENRLNEGV